MRLEVRLFGGLSERAGGSRLHVELPEEADVAQLRAAIAEQHPGLAPLLPKINVAIDLTVASDDQPVTAASEVALLPPVAGGATPGDLPGAESSSGEPVRVLADGRRVLCGLREPPLPLDAAVAAIAGPQVGGVVTFVGRVRDHAPDLDEPVVRLDYQAYPEMADRVLDEIADELLAGSPDVLGVVLLHAVGELAVGDPTILVACAAAHRGPAFDACRTALEEVKDRVPVFKREVTASGAHRWVGLEPDPGGDPPS
jgi:MoaE-MoaD fusion protein